MANFLRSYGWLLTVAVMLGAFQAAYVLAGVVPSTAAQLIAWYTLPICLTMWVQEDARSRRCTPCFDLVFPVTKLITILSECMTLEPGDVIVTGTPSGVGSARKPPIWMKSGDKVDVHVPRLGTLSNRVEDE